MNRKFFKGPVLTLLAAAVWLGGNALAQAQPAPDGGKPGKSKPTKSAAKSGAAGTGGKVKFISGSGETPGQRSARLKRECKGAVDAGACTGYTR